MVFGMGSALGMGGAHSPSPSHASTTSPLGSTLAASSRSGLPEYSASKAPLGGGLPSRFRGEGTGGAGPSSLMSEVRGLGSGASRVGGGDTDGESLVGGGKAREYASMSASQQQMFQQRLRGVGGGGGGAAAGAPPSSSSSSSATTSPGVPSLFGRGSKSMQLPPAGAAAAAAAAAAMSEADRVLVQGKKVSAPQTLIPEPVSP